MSLYAGFHDLFADFSPFLWKPIMIMRYYFKVFPSSVNSYACKYRTLTATFLESSYDAYNLPITYILGKERVQSFIE